MSLTPQQQRIVAIADELAATFAARAPKHDADSSFPHENWPDLHGSGYLRLVIPREYGGEGASVLDMVIAPGTARPRLRQHGAGRGHVISVLGRAVEIEPGRSRCSPKSAASWPARAAG